jgi:hypothetical protein
VHFLYYKCTKCIECSSTTYKLSTTTARSLQDVLGLCTVCTTNVDYAHNILLACKGSTVDANCVWNVVAPWKNRSEIANNVHNVRGCRLRCICTFKHGI